MMKRLERVKQIMLRYWSIVWLISAIVCALSLIAYAEYETEKTRVRRVVANVSSGGQMFSSNYLEKDTLLYRSPFNTGTDGYCEIPVKIWNYSISNPMRAYQGDLPYQLTATLVKQVTRTETYTDSVTGETKTRDVVDYDPIALSELDNTLHFYIGTEEFVWNGTAYTVQSSGDPADSGVYSFASSFEAGKGYQPDTHEYIVKFPEDLLSDDTILVKLEARPLNGDVNLSEISAVLGIRPSESALVQGWNGDFGDTKTFTDYDAFNYVFSGNGEADITFKWCTDYLQLSQASLAEYGLTATTATKPTGASSDNWKQVSFHADANNGEKRYDFQLYMTGDPATDYGDEDNPFWSVVGSYVDKTIA